MMNHRLHPAAEKEIVMDQPQCRSMHTHMGSLTPYTDIPALRIVQRYFSVIDSLDFDANEHAQFFSENAVFFDTTNDVYRSSETIWNGIKARFAGFEFVHHQPCLTRVFGPDVRSLKEGDRHVVSVQAIMLCRLKNWEEERIIEIPRMFEFVVGTVEEHSLERNHGEQVEVDEPGEETESREVRAENNNLAPRPKRGYQGLHIYEGRVWWDSGVLAKAIEEKQKEEERRRFREIMTMNNGFLGQRPRR